MKVIEFIEQYNAKENKVNFVRNNITTQYIPYEVKVDKCLKILDSTCYRENKKTGKKELYIVSTSINLLYKMVLIDLYTDIDVNFNDILKEYNLLNNGRNCLQDILNNIPEREYVEFDEILNMCKQDMMINEYQVGAYIKNRIEDISIILGTTLSPFLDKLIETVGNLDENKIEKILRKIQ